MLYINYKLLLNFADWHLTFFYNFSLPTEVYNNINRANSDNIKDFSKNYHNGAHDRYMQLLLYLLENLIFQINLIISQEANLYFIFHY